MRRNLVRRRLYDTVESESRIVEDEESTTGGPTPWPVRVAQALEQRPRLAVGSAVAFLAIVALLTTSTWTAKPPGTQPPPPGATASPTVVQVSSLPGLAFQHFAAVSGTRYDLIFSVTAGPSPQGGGRLTYVFRLDTASGWPELLVWRPADERQAEAFADPRGRVMVVAWQSGLAVLPAAGLTGATGPALDVVSVLFLGADHDPAGLVLASTPTSVVDITRPDRQRVLATAGGTLLGRLDDGRVVLGSMSGTDLVVRAVALDGAVVELGRITRALGPAALQRFPTPASGFRVLALRQVEQGFPGAGVVSALDLGTGAITDLQVLGLEATFAPETSRPGVYVFTHRSEQHISGRGTANIDVPAGRRAFLDALRSWSPDGALIAFASQTPPAKMGLTAITRDGRLLVDLQPLESATVRLIGWRERH
jgi:hypothetical protein